MLPEADACYRAMVARDRRLDGVFFVAVKTTGIYCRPICPARTPKRSSCHFYRTAAQAEAQGFRACFRCRPELAPGDAPVDAVWKLAEAAAGRIAAGALNGHRLDELAAEFDVTARHLRRALGQRLGVAPVELAQSHRLAFAKRLLQDSSMPLTELAFAAGFQSIRRFNAVFAQRYGRPPSAVRRELADRSEGTRLRLDYRPPLAWGPLLRFLWGRAIPGVETVDLEVLSWARTVTLEGHRGWVQVRHHPTQPALVAEASLSLTPVLMALTARLREVFDLDAQPRAIDAVLRMDPLLKGRVARTPGLRVPGAFDPFEATVRAVLGQQVTVKGATTLAGRFAARFGRGLATPRPELFLTFPSKATIAAASVEQVAAVGLPRARAATLLAVSQAPGLVRGAPIDQTLARLQQLPGIGPWTAQYLAMRALGWPDAFPASDLGVLKALGATEKAALRRAERWRPWRAYATLHLWSPA